MLKILFHCHVFPKGIFERNAPEAGIEGTPEELSRCTRELGFDKAVALAPGEAEEGNYGVDGDPNQWLREAVEDDDRLIPFMRLNPDHGRRAIDDMARYASKGFAGIKIHPESQGVDMRNEALDPFFAAAEDLGLPIVTHTGVLHGKMPLYTHEPMLFEPFIAEHPNLVLIMAHMGGLPYFRQVVGLMQSYPNVYGDITGMLTPSMWYIPPDELYLLHALGLSDRLIYGCDWPWGGVPHVQGQLDTLAASRFSEEEKSAILGGTLAKVLGL